MEIMTAKDLRILPLKNVAEKIYDMVVASALRGHTFVDFTMCLLLEYYNMNVDLDTPENVAYIFEELRKLFPGVLFLIEKCAIRMEKYYGEHVGRKKK